MIQRPSAGRGTVQIASPEMTRTARGTSTEAPSASVCRTVVDPPSQLMHRGYGIRVGSVEIASENERRCVVAEEDPVEQLIELAVCPNQHGRHGAPLDHPFVQGRPGVVL